MNSTAVGIVFNIQRFSIHDGPGIRSTVFLKGCPLRCSWCHNPEGISLKVENSFHDGRCIACGACAAVCPEGAQLLEEGRRVYDRDLCRLCGRCVEECFAGALVAAARRMTVAQVLDELLADSAFFASSGGGVTLSGGDPLVQAAFSAAILARCKSEGLHTAIQTAAYCRWETLAGLLPLVDLVMLDIKHMDAAKHRAATGVPNRRILANARRLAQTDRPLLIRVPVVPGVNDTVAEIAAIATFVAALNELRPAAASGRHIPPPISMELLPFHRLASDKYRALGLEYRAGTLQSPATSLMRDLVAAAASCGVIIYD